MLVPMGPISGMKFVARELIAHFEIDPDAHGDLALEVEFAIGDEMLTMMREILRERGIPIPAEVDALPPIGNSPAGKTRRRGGRAGAA